MSTVNKKTHNSLCRMSVQLPGPSNLIKVYPSHYEKDVTAWLKLRLTLSFWYVPLAEIIFKINKGDGFFVPYLCEPVKVGLPRRETHTSSLFVWKR